MSATDRFRVLGIDPGLNITGYGAVDFAAGGLSVVEAGTITTDAKSQTATRIAQIFEEVSALLGELRPDAVAIEKLYAHYKHPRTAILMAHARGVILLAARQAGIGVRSVPATQVKKAVTGNGHASKQQVQHAVQTVCKLQTLPQPADVADALAIALTAGRRLAGP
jgi:crossover junction endodeoxyribonuclease RuvC